MKQPKLCFANRKSFKVNRQFVRNIELKLYDFFSTQRIFSGDVSIYNHHTWKIVRNLPKFYHRIHAWNHDTTKNFMIIRICMVLIDFFNDSTKRSWSWFVSKIFKIYFCFRHTSSHWTTEYEYYFSIHYIPLSKHFQFNHQEIRLLKLND